MPLTDEAIQTEIDDLVTDASRRARQLEIPTWYEAARRSSSAFITVNTLDGDNDGVCGTDGSDARNDCSLLEALDLANADLAGDVVQFAVSGAISPATAPTITTPVEVDGTLNGRTAGDIVIDGAEGCVNAALSIVGANAAGAVVRGLSLISSLNGVYVSETEGVLVEDNLVGTDRSGADLGNARIGIFVSETSSAVVSGNTVMFNDRDGIGLSIASSAIVSGNTVGYNRGEGIYIGDYSSGIIIEDNFVGTNGAGTDLGNEGNGIELQETPSAIVARNTVGFNGGDGIGFFGYPDESGAIIEDNYIGTNASGADLGNSGSGISVGNAPSALVSDNTVGFNANTGVFVNSAASAIVSGNVVRSNRGDGVVVDESDDVVIEGNLVGTDASGTDLGNSRSGILVQDATSVVVSGNTTGFNGFGGITIRRAPGASVSRNYVGTDATGADLGNRSNGIFVNGTSIIEVSDNTVGFNILDGISIGGPIEGAFSAVVQANFVGTDGAGADLGNGGRGIDVQGAVTSGAGSMSQTLSGQISGTPALVAGNTVGFNASGISVSNVSAALIRGNGVGTNGSGTDFGNDGSGLFVGNAPSASISMNRIGFNGSDGVFINGSRDVVFQGNFVGTDEAGADLGNGNAGVFLNLSPSAEVSDNAVGFNDSWGIFLNDAAVDEVLRNTVRSNGGEGIVVSGPDASVAILSNALSDNGRLGINVGDDGLTANDAGDADTGANGLQNFPVLTLGASGALQIALDSTPNTTFRVEVFVSDAPDPSGYGEGARYLGAVLVTTDGSGQGTETADGLVLAPGEWVTATATPEDASSASGYGGTSEFSEAVEIPVVEVPVSFAVARQTVSEGAGSVRIEVAVGVEETPDDPATVTVALASGDAGDLGGFASESFIVGGPGDDAVGGVYAVTIPITDDVLAEDDEVFVFRLTVEAGAPPEYVVGSPSETVVVVVDDDADVVTVTVPAESGPFLFASPVSGLTAGAIVATSGGASVYAYDSGENAFVEVSDDGIVFSRGQLILVDGAGGDLDLTGTATGDVVTYLTDVDVEGRILALVGNPTDRPVAISDVSVVGGTLTDVALVFDGEAGAFRPISLSSLGFGSMSGGAAAELFIPPFSGLVLQATPDDGSAVSFSLDTAAIGPASGTDVTQAAFVPVEGESAVVLEVASADGEVFDRLALRFGVGIEALDAFDGLEVGTPTGPTLATSGWTERGESGGVLGGPFAALSGYDLEHGPVTVPLVVTVPKPGDYVLSLVGPVADAGPRSVTVEAFDGTAATVLVAGASLAFTLSQGADLNGRFSVQVSLGAAVSNEEAALEGAALSVWPNPSTGKVQVAVSVLEAGPLRVSVYDVLGREVTVLHEGTTAAGVLEVAVTRALAPGSYVVRAVGAVGAETRFLTVVR